MLYVLLGLTKLKKKYYNLKRFKTKEIEMLTAEGVAKRLKLHPNTVRKYARWGKLPAKKFGRVWMIEEKDLEDFIRAREQELTYESPR